MGCSATRQRTSRNLDHYLALRQHDVRELQRELAARGLSSLGRAEAHVLSTLDAVLGYLGVTVDPAADGAPNRAQSRELLQRHSVEALGPLPTGDRVRLMVTMPEDVAGDRRLVQELIDDGMDLARIKTAHDDPATWVAIAEAVRAGADDAGREVRIAFDLAGPKLCTGPLPVGPEIVKLRPQRSPDGFVQRQATARFRAECVMLNKGPHIVEAIRFRDDVFDRMHEHQEERTPLLRCLSVSTASQR